MRSRLYQEHQQYYQPIIQKLERRVAEQNVKNATEKKRGEQLEGELERTKLIISRFVYHIAELKARDHLRNVRSRVFKAWADIASGRAIMANMTVRLYLTQPMRRILFKRWVRRMRKVRQQRLGRELRHVCQQDISQKETEASQRICALKSELQAVQQLLIEHEKQHGEMQEKLRRAFMRGVVNLNLEAMDVFGEVPTTEVVPPPVRKSAQLAAATQDSSDDDGNDFFVEPAPKISVIRHR
ncbi:hypothetical protein TRFO_16743 [Tritrichomonas foetus]|uniref:Centrosomal protein POC5 n=1 Tax=Tritrichomonas foetus TaxID=1144522 RepID=A0A1J4KTU5_9EUKA|nr:hypothetical protein TRFO_16743 [Tritrichomonas foetus]|eukprot:OHT13188.1 hypothetical protein TRFO_16743 [Tritrichomonas foetus]